MVVVETGSWLLHRHARVKLPRLATVLAREFGLLEGSSPVFESSSRRLRMRSDLIDSNLDHWGRCNALQDLLGGLVMVLLL